MPTISFMSILLADNHNRVKTSYSSLIWIMDKTIMFLVWLLYSI